MTLLEQLQSHAGGLVKIKTQLFWYGRRGLDGTPDRICLILDAAAPPIAAPPPIAAAATPIPHAVDAAPRIVAAVPRAAALLLIDGAPHWIWISEDTVELL